MPVDIAALFADPLYDLGEHDPALRGILAAGPQPAEIAGVTHQFLEDAAEYHRRYASARHFRILIDNALSMLDSPVKPGVILDLGSGSGNSVVPLLDRFPDACVVAVDASPRLLAILRDHLAGRGEYRDRYALVCMDACEDRYRTGAFDLAVGAAILHHVLAPKDVIRACEHALRPGGAAIFFEPFASGHALLDLAFRHIIGEAVHRKDASPGIAVLERLTADYAARRRDPGDPLLLALDDKWMFDRAFFGAIAERGHWSEARILPIHDAGAPLTEQTRNLLRLMADADASALPPWAWATLHDYESAFSPRARRALILEAAVVLRLSEVWNEPGSGWWWNPDEPGRGFFLEVARGRVRATCCTYDEEGAPIVYTTEPEAFSTDQDVTLRWQRSLHARDDPRRVAQAEVTMRLRVESARSVKLASVATSTSLTPQRAENPGFSGWASHALSGTWIEDSDRARWKLLVEALDDCVVIALLSDVDWCIAEASRIGPRAYAGHWRRFCRGQTLTGDYRRPMEPEDMGEARLVWTDEACVTVTLPSGRRIALARLPIDAN